MTGLGGFEPLAYVACAALLGLGVPLAVRRAVREARWWLGERRAERDRQASTQPAYAAELAAAREEQAARRETRAQESAARVADARALRPVGTDLGILRSAR